MTYHSFIACAEGKPFSSVPSLNEVAVVLAPRQRENLVE